MLSTLATQSRMASLMASLSVRAAGGDGDDLGAEQPHAGDVERLPLGVVLAHVDDALEPEQRGGGGGGDAVLAGAGLGDDPGLAHPLGQQRLAEDVVDLVRAGVVEVLALEDDPGAAGVLGEPRHLGDDARAPGVGAVQPLELAQERGVRPSPCGGASSSSSSAAIERLGDEAAAEVAEAGPGAGAQAASAALETGSWWSAALPRMSSDGRAARVAARAPVPRRRAPRRRLAGEAR